MDLVRPAVCLFGDDVGVALSVLQLVAVGLGPAGGLFRSLPPEDFFGLRDRQVRVPQADAWEFLALGPRGGGCHSAVLAEKFLLGFVRSILQNGTVL